MKRLAICLSIAGLALRRLRLGAGPAAARRGEGAANGRRRPIRWRAWRGRWATASPARRSAFVMNSRQAGGRHADRAGYRADPERRRRFDGSEVCGMDGITLAGNAEASFTAVERASRIDTRCRCCRTAPACSTSRSSVNTQIAGSSLGRTFSIPFVGRQPAQQKPAAAERRVSGRSRSSRPKATGNARKSARVGVGLEARAAGDRR